MSFPNIPDINPYININFEDAINLLLTSIAMEEISLSKLIDAETDKILCVLDNCKYDDCRHIDCEYDNCKYKDLDNLLKINKSVDDVVKHIIKLQMLLQFKLENIKEILPCTSSTTTTSTSTTTTTHTTTCTTSTCSTTTKKECCCSLDGNGNGCVSNCHDEFYNNIAMLDASVYCCGKAKNRSVHYLVGDDKNSLCVSASGNNIKIQCPKPCSDKLVIYGKAFAEKYLNCAPDVNGNVEFILTVIKKDLYDIEFRMEIKSEIHPELNHDSGFVKIISPVCDLILVICY